jgi:predicted DNA-binding protein (UPF0251 family)
MARPVKCRRVDFFPGITYFKPAGIPLKLLEEICLSVEEMEAIRLKELEGLEQEQGAERMNISRPTFQRILSSARTKLADALLNGKAIRIEGGNFQLSPRKYRCCKGHEWDVPFEIADSRPPEDCPTCKTSEIEAVRPPRRDCARRARRRCCEERGQPAEAGE